MHPPGIPHPQGPPMPMYATKPGPEAYMQYPSGNIYHPSLSGYGASPLPSMYVAPHGGAFYQPQHNSQPPPPPFHDMQMCVIPPTPLDKGKQRATDEDGEVHEYQQAWPSPLVSHPFLPRPPTVPPPLTLPMIPMQAPAPMDVDVAAAAL